MDKPQFLKTRFVPFSFASSTHPAYKAICQEREAASINLFRVYDTGGKCHYGPERDVVLETAHVFGNQWNTAPDEFSPNGFRVFNWYEGIVPNRDMRIGHYLVVTDEMRELCKLTHKCGYCGAQYQGLEHAERFCTRCLDSEYLKKADIHLLRLKPVDINGGFADRAQLTEAESAILLPQYIERQTIATDSRAVAKAKADRVRIEADYVKDIAKLKAEHDGKIWLLDRHVNLDNVIYYSHTGKFSFGWRSPLDEEVKSRLLDILPEFPFAYEFAARK